MTERTVKPGNGTEKGRAMLEAMKGTFFRNLFFSFFLLMNILLLAFSAALFGQWEAARRERNYQENHSQVNLTARVIDEKFSAVELAPSQIASSEWLKYVSARSEILYSRVDYQKKKEICQTIGNQNDSLGIAKTTAVLLPSRNLAVDKVSFWENERYFKSIGMDAEIMESIAGQLENRYGSLVLFTNQRLQEDNHSFAVLRQLEYAQNTEKILFVYVDGKRFSSFLKNAGNNLYSLEISYEGTPVYEWKGQGAPEDNLYHEQVKSTLHNWSYSITLQNKEYYDFNKGTGFLLFCGVLGIMILEFAVAWQLASFSVKPVRSLMEKLGIRKTKKISMLEAIEQSYRDLNTEKEWMESLGNQYYQIAEAGYLSSLLFGTFEKDTVLEYARKFRLPFRQEMYCQALLFQYLGESDKLFMDAMLKLQIECYKEGVTAVFCREENVLLLEAADGGREAVQQQEERVRILLDEMFPDLEVEMHSGKIYKGFEGIAKSFREGREKQLTVQSQGQMTYYYPLELELKMINSMKLGNFELAEEILKVIKEENEARQLLASELTRVLSLVFEVFWRFVEDMRLELPDLKYEFIQEINEEKKTEGWDFLFLSLHRIQEKYEEYGTGRTLGKELVAYVDAHYESSELSQQDIADSFHISRPMVSKIFKETAKMNFIDYLHKKRVEHAKYCFEQGETDVILVAQKVGYENEVTFKRAFVKNEGVTPREYVKLWKEKNGR